MSASDTPRTDAALHAVQYGTDRYSFPNFARQLERELVAERAKVAELASIASKFVPPHYALCCDMSQPKWPVTEQSCQCPPDVKALRAAIAKAGMEGAEP